MASNQTVAFRRLAFSAVFVAALGAGFLGASFLHTPAKLPVKVTSKFEFPLEDYIAEPDDPQLGEALEVVGQKVPPLSVSGWVNGEVRPADMKGKVVLLDLWATWCAPCVKAIPHNNEMLAKYKDQGLVIVGICTSDTGQEKFPEAVTKYGIGYPACVDPELKTVHAFKSTFYPNYVAIDRTGTVRAVGLTPSKVEDVLTKLLAEKGS